VEKHCRTGPGTEIGSLPWPGHFRCIRRPSIGELGVPTESWQRVYDKNQKKFSLQLAAGVVLFSSTVLAAYNIVETNSTPHHLLK